MDEHQKHLNIIIFYVGGMKKIKYMYILANRRVHVHKIMWYEDKILDIKI